MSGGLSSLPRIYIDISQPGDRGSFLIKTLDWTTQKEIFQNRLPESISEIQYLYTARLLENRSRTLRLDAPADDSWMRTDRYQDIVRYGQKLYKDLFGDKGQMQNYVKRTKHLHDGVRYVLRLHNTASELWNIPWEYLHDGSRFIAIEPTCNLVRSALDISLDKDARKMREIPRPLRILILIADPHGAVPLNVDQEVQSILDALKPAIKAGLVETDIIEEGSMRNLEMLLADEQYHILHYTGHGAMSPQGSFLAMEDDEGQVQPAFIQNLLPAIRSCGSLRLVVLNGCQTGQIDETRAMSGIATGLLAAVPAVVAMQFSVLDSSAQVFSRVFFEQIGRGEILEDAMHAARGAMNTAHPSLTDWGVPSLYVHSLGMRLVDSTQPPTRHISAPPLALDPLPNPAIFVGRRDEQRQLRQALPNLHINMTYIWGMSGVGKSALAGRVLRRPGRKGIINSVLVIPCDQVQPAEILAKLAAWLEPLFPNATAALKNPQLPPDQRIQQAASHVRGKRLVLIFDRFDVYLKESADRHHYEVPNPLLESLFRALASAQWSILTVFTSRYRWSFLTEVYPDNHLEIHLSELAPYEVGMMLARLPKLREIEMATLGEILQKTGGHPATIMQLEGQAAKDRDQLLLNLPKMPKMLAKWWHGQFLGVIFERLTPAERATLLSICVMDGPFWAGYVQIVANTPTREAAEAIMARWEAYSLVHFLGTDGEEAPWYSVHELIRTCLIQGCPPEQLKELHRRAAKVVETDLAKMAASRYENVGGQRPIKDDPYMTARMELRLIMDTADPSFGAIILRRALGWRKHFLQIEEFERAASIVNDIWEAVAFRYNEPEMAREMLEETVRTAEGKDQAVARMNLGEFLLREGKLDETMRLYETSIREFSRLEDEYNLAVTTGKMANLYQQMGKTDKAIKSAESALKAWEGLRDASGQAQTLRQISAFYSSKEQYKKALDFVQRAEIMLRGEKDWQELVNVLQTMGTVYKHLNDYDRAINCFQNVLNIASQFGGESQFGSALSEVGSVFMIVGQWNDAAKVMLESISIAERLRDEASLATRLYRLATIYEQQRNRREAQVIGERALALAQKHQPTVVGEIQGLLRRVR
jgi:tetratricopeptide (TPR) repeat protein